MPTFRRPGTYQKHQREAAKRHGTFGPRPENDTAPAPRASRGQRLYRANLRYGSDLEHKAIECFSSSFAPPHWYRSIRPASHQEDQAGIDMWVETDRGPIAVQVKSSAYRAKEFVEEHPGMEVAVVVLHITMEPERVRERVLGAVERVWMMRREAA